jgi:hypothetical protein
MDSGFLGPQFATMLVLGLLVGALGVVLVGGALLRWSVRWVGGFAPGYWRSCLAVLLACVAGVVVQVALAVALRSALGLGGMMPGPLVSVALALVGMGVMVAVTAAAVRVLLHRPDATPLSFARSAGAAASFIALGTALYVVVIGALILGIGGVPGVSR